MDLNIGGFPFEQQSSKWPVHWFLGTPPKPAPMKRSLDSQEIPDLNSLMNVPVVSLTPLAEKSGSSSANKTMNPPFAPITPDKVNNRHQCEPKEAAHPVTEGFNKKRRVEFDMLHNVEIEEQIDLSSNNGLNTPDKNKSAQGCQTHQVTSSFDEEGSVKISKNKKALSKHVESSSEGEDEEKGKKGMRTPQKKVPKRKKHRPKIELEDKLKKTPKPVTPTTDENKEKPLTKRTYVRRKKSLDSLETTSNTGKENTERLTPKRTYVRRKKSLNSLEVSSSEVAKTEMKRTTANEKAIDPLKTASGETTYPRSSRAIREPVNEPKSVRRSLNFSAEGEATDGDLEAFNGINTVCNKELALDLTEGLELFITKSPETVEYDAYELNCATSKFLEEYLKLPDTFPPFSQNVDKHLEGSNRKEDTENGINQQNDVEQLVSDSKVDAVLVDENIEKPNDTQQHSEDILFSHVYKEAKEYNLRQDLIHFFPVIYKKRRTDRGQILGCNRVAVHKVKYHPFGDEESSKELDELPQSELVLALIPDMRMTKKRSKVPTRARKLTFTTTMDDCSHLLWSPERIRSSLGMSEYKNYGPESCVEALFADTRFKITTKKPRNKEYFDLVSSLGQSFVVGVPTSQAGQWNNLNGLEVGSIEDIHSRRFNIRGSLYASFLSQEIVSYKDPVDIIVEKMKHLQINEGHAAVTKAYSSIVPYSGGGGMIVPYENIFDIIKKQRPRAKVDLDPETNRVWNLLMGKKSTDKDDEEDMDKEKWWEEERQVFRGRAESFIARMHLILGDRRFSKWKGSVVDSVVGVFLTQNVSDHLSSSAFMSLAAKFPLRSESSTREASTGNMNTPTEQGDDSILASTYNNKWQKDISIPASTDSGSMGINESKREADEVTKALRSNDTEETDHSESNDLHLHGTEEKKDFEPLQKMDILTTAETICFEDLEDRISSQKSPSERSPEYLSQTTRHVGLGSSSVTILEDHLALKISRDSDSSTSSLQRMENIGVVGEGYESCVPSNNSEDSKTCDIKITEGSDSYFGWLTLSSDFTATTTFESHVSESKFSVQISTCSETEICLPHDKIEESSGENTSGEYPRVDDELTVKVLHAEGGADFQAENTCKEVEIQTATEHCREPKKCLFSCNDLEETVESSQTDESTNLKGEAYCSQEDQPEKQKDTLEAKKVNVVRERKKMSEWESLQKEAIANGTTTERSSETMDSLDWEAVRNADVNVIANIIRERGMNYVLAQRIKDFLNRLLDDHGSIDLEWLRDVPPDKAKDYLLSIRGLGIKSVECVRLLTLEHLAFPVDTNVGRISVRLGWVPLQPLPESLQLHLLELYPMIEQIQKYLWPRLCTLDQRMLYELHYQMITFGKVFCTKTKPNCNACPMRGECKHFASAFASARLALPGPEEKRIVNTGFPSVLANGRNLSFSSLPQPQLEGSQPVQGSITYHCEPIIEEPATPEHECVQTLENEIEDAFYEDPDGIPIIKLCLEEFKENLKSYMQDNNLEVEDGDMSKALVALAAEAASIPMPKLKNVNRLRTEHHVYELPDSHPLLEGVDRRVSDDPCPYLLAIWTPGETAQSTEPPQSCCNSQDSSNLCERKTCFACNSVREAEAQTVRGTLLIPCRTAMRGSFPLNGTYFQVNEVFADHNSSRKPIYVPRNWLWNLPRRTVYFGTSVSTIFKGLTMEGIQLCFWRGFVCVRGFDRTSRAPKPLYARLHFSPSMAVRNRRGSAEDETNHRRAF